jgi:hypothetical protein
MIETWFKVLGRDMMIPIIVAIAEKATVHSE